LKTGGITVLNRPARGTWDTEAAWSPDGKQIAFGCNLSPAATVGRSDICIMNAGGTHSRVLAHESGAAEWVTWSPDGTQVAFQRDGDNYTIGAIVVHDIRTGAERIVSTNTGYALNETPAWSPVGTWIALQVKTARGYRIALMHPDGSAFRLVATE
jgi:Tol biopolymer transport system component